jgi:hypothetical protein
MCVFNPLNASHYIVYKIEEQNIWDKFIVRT